jgi:hypothetical protein
MKTSVGNLLATVLSVAMVADSIAAEPDRSTETPGRSKSTTVTVDPNAIAKLIEDINAAARTNKQRMLTIIVINTDVASTTLEQEKAQHGLTLGDVYVAHSLALATGKKVNSIFALHKSGKTWAQIAKSHNVSLKGSSELIKEMQKQ